MPSSGLPDGFPLYSHLGLPPFPLSFLIFQLGMSSMRPLPLYLYLSTWDAPGASPGVLLECPWNLGEKAPSDSRQLEECTPARGFPHELGAYGANAQHALAQ